VKLFKRGSIGRRRRRRVGVVEVIAEVGDDVEWIEIDRYR